MKNGATSLISRLRDFLSCLAPLKSLEYTLVALEHLPSALCLLTCSQKSTLKFSAPFPLASFPRSKKKLSKTHTPKLSIYFFVPCGSPATFFICLGCYSNGILSGSHPHPCSPGSAKLLCSLRHISRCDNIQCFRHLKQIPPSSSSRL